MSFTLAHFSDVHLGPVAIADVFGDFRLKRIIGGLSWGLRRRAMHIRAHADALRADIHAQAPDHICFTGDLVNIAARAEFRRGLEWLKTVGTPADLTMVPGNHDAYVHLAHDTGLGLLNPFMEGDGSSNDHIFPFVRLRRNIAIIGLSSAQPQRLNKAGGTLGKEQRTALATRLADLGARGFYRLVMIHHPPLPGLTPARRALTDAPELREVLKDSGAELVIHGHNHTTQINGLDTASGRAFVVGVPSASMVDKDGHESAQWHAYSVNRARGKWQTRLTIRRLHGATGRFVDVRSGILGQDIEA
ncbi:MAG: metallophosphoesterase [Rhizobiales bacterium]|nr:metallophosphoesterase [Hyphomicrobiales bacterium]